MMNQTIPQNAMSAMYFVDGANENQLRAMVAAKNPFSVFALSRLQSIRDAKMKAQAGQPEPPPLSQEIPQQLDQLSKPQQAQGIQQPMPQQAMQQQPMQPPMGLASIGGAPTGAGGGMVAFKDGGGIRRFGLLDSKDQLVEEPESRFGRFARAYGERLNDLLPSSTESRQDFVNELNRRKDINRQIDERQVGMFTPETTQDRIKREGEIDALNAQLKQQSVSPTTTTLPNAGAGRSQGMGDDPQQRAAESGIATVKNNKAPSGAYTGDISTGGKSVRMPRLGINAADESQNYLNSAGSGIANLMAMRADNPERQEAMGNISADRAAELKSRQAAFPDPYGEYIREVKGDRTKLSGDKENIFNKALLTTAFGLLNPSVRGQGVSGLFSAIGEAGQKGFSEFQKLSDVHDEKNQKLRALEVNLATQQEARSRGMYDTADKMARDERGLRLDLYKNDQDSTRHAIMAGIQLDMHKADIPFKQADLELKKMSNYIQQQQANKPDEFQRKLQLANVIGKATNVDPALVLKDLAFGSMEGRLEIAAAKNATDAVKDILEPAEKAQRYQEYYLLQMDGFKNSGTGSSGKLVTDKSGKMVWEQGK